MRIVVSAGGTGGHIYPAIALINKIKEIEPKTEVLYIGTHNRMEKDIIPKYDVNYYPLEVSGLKRKLSFDNIKAIYQFLKAIFKAKDIIADFGPDVVVGFGGYVTAPVIVAAKRLGIPTLIHEQNSVAGLTNRFLSKIASRVAVSFEENLKSYGKKGFLSGNPCSEAAVHKKALRTKPFKNNLPTIVMVSGSLGSGSINKIMCSVLPKLKDKPYNFVYVTGKGNETLFNKVAVPKNVLIKPYLDDAVSYLKAADLFISRAGATTISEVEVIGVPTIFIPSPYVTNNHQYLNAKSLVDKNAALMLEEKDLNPKQFISMIDQVIADKGLRTILSRNIKKQAIKNSATLIYQELVAIKK